MFMNRKQTHSRKAAELYHTAFLLSTRASFWGEGLSTEDLIHVLSKQQSKSLNHFLVSFHPFLFPVSENKPLDDCQTIN